MFKPTITFLALSLSVSLHAATVDLRLLETTDLHSNMMDFDYYKDTPDREVRAGTYRVANPCRASGSEEQRAGG